MENVKEGGGTKFNPAAAATATVATECDSPSNLPLLLPLQSSSRTPFTNLCQVDADLVLAPTLQEQGRRSGTVNCFVMYNEGILLGVDSRSATMISKYTPELKFPIVQEDGYIKYKILIEATEKTPAVGITAAGDYSRNSELWKMLELFVKSGKKDILDVVEEISRFLYRTPAKTENEKPMIYLYLAGYSTVCEEYIVYFMGDRIPTETFHSSCPEKGYFHATGSGGSYALEILQKGCSSGMTITEASSLIMDALLSAVLNDGGSGGILSVYQLTVPRGKPNTFNSILSSKLVIDGLLLGITDHKEMKSSLLFLFPDNLPMDVGLIFCLLQRFCFVQLSNIPIYLAKVQGWRIYFVNFGDDAGARNFFKKGYHKDGFLFSEARGLDIDSYKFVLARASVHILRKIKDGIYKSDNA